MPQWLCLCLDSLVFYVEQDQKSGRLERKECQPRLWADLRVAYLREEQELEKRVLIYDDSV